MHTVREGEDRDTAETDPDQGALTMSIFEPMPPIVPARAYVRAYVRAGVCRVCVCARGRRRNEEGRGVCVHTVRGGPLIRGRGGEVHGCTVEGMYKWHAAKSNAHRRASSSTLYFLRFGRGDRIMSCRPNSRCRATGAKRLA